MKKRTAESLYEMMQPLSDHHRIHTRHCEMLRFFKALAINTSWCSPRVTTNEVEKPLSGAKSSTNKMHGSPCLTHAKLNSLQCRIKNEKFKGIRLPSAKSANLGVRKTFVCCETGRADAKAVTLIALSIQTTEI